MVEWLNASENLHSNIPFSVRRIFKAMALLILITPWGQPHFLLLITSGCFDSESYVGEWFSTLGEPFSVFQYFKSQRIKKDFISEGDFLFTVFLQDADGRQARHSANFSSARLLLALEVLALPSAKNSAQSRFSRIDKGIKMILFLQGYCKLLVGVLFGGYETAYPLGLRWRWRHKNYRNL